MQKKSNTKDLSKIQDILNNLTENKFTLYFFVLDSKNIPNGEMSYVYDIALTLKEIGYNVKMLYQIDNEYTKREYEDLVNKGKEIDENRVFIGVRKWLGDAYADLDHMNISTQKWEVSPSDFLFIPEAFASLMQQTHIHALPCKRYIIVHNYNYITDFIPLGLSWLNYGIYNAITNNEKHQEMVKDIFPFTRVNILKPFISKKFRKPEYSKELVVTIISKSQNDAESIIKPFYWKHPTLKFVSFRDVRGMSKEDYAEALKESPITVWIDDKTPFGYGALEAMACGNIVLGKVPERLHSWMYNEDYKLTDSCYFFTDTAQVPDMLARLVIDWMNDSLDMSIYDDMEKTLSEFTYERWTKDIKKLFSDIVKDRVKQVTSFKKMVKEESVKEEKVEEVKE